MPWPAALDRARPSRSHRPPGRARTYHPVLKHSRFAAKLRAGRYVRALPGGLRCPGSFFARMPLGQGGASSLIIPLLRELLLLRLFLWFWVYLFLLN